ncbi:divergent polysaccharide deacetylase family protein [Aestuariispira ectoiniformans]|uniref:divergent polysaccharide deacetylase family protein n=1 Tax=Aestuariispira ectoiniformans TaxID=2775080 RepID=UPI00223B9936|nr:divergent polysaccharide deacetylase family protein [Aestuariispira ectoiniformans]
MKKTIDLAKQFKLLSNRAGAMTALVRVWAQGKGPFIWAGSFTGFGVVLGMGIGYFLAQPSDDPGGQVAATTPDTNQIVAQYQGRQSEDDIEYNVPVRVDRSERALKKYRYEEDLSPELLGGAGDSAENGPAVPSGMADPIDQLVANLDKGADQSTIQSEERLPGDKPAKRLPETTSETQLQWQKAAIETPGIIKETRPLIAIVIDDVGIDQKRSRHSIDLAAPLTLSFIPYGHNLQELVDLARKYGHEVMLHMPMEPMSAKVDPGPNALLTSLDKPELSRRVNWDMKQFDGYIGINNHMGSKFTAWKPGMRLVLQEMKKRGLVFLDSITSPKTVGYDMARELDVPVTRRDVFLDNVQDKKAIIKQLRQTEHVARQNGQAIAIGHPHDETILALQEWLPQVKARGFRLVPVSAIIRRNQATHLAQQDSATE